MVQPILSRTIEDLKPALLQLLNVFPKAKVIYCDNEPPLNSHTILTMLENHFDAKIYRCSLMSSNGWLFKNCVIFRLPRMSSSGSPIIKRRSI